MPSVFAKANQYPIKALRGRQGGRVFYLALPSQKELDGFYHREPETPPKPDERVQRPFDPKRAEEIARYIDSNRTEYVLGALTFAVDTDGYFDETEPGSDVGVLWLPLSATMRSIDGQHRAGGVRKLLQDLRELEEQHVGVLIYVEPAITKRRQMFSDMNSHQKRVSASINIAFDARDPFARAARGIANSHPLLKTRVEDLQPSVRAQSDKLYTLKAVYDTLKAVQVGIGGRVRNTPTEKAIIAAGRELFDLLVAARPELAKVADGRVHASQLREASLLASGPTLRAIAGGYRTAKDKGASSTQISRRLRALDFTSGNKQWISIGFVAPGKLTPSSRLQELKSAENYIGKVLTSDA